MYVFLILTGASERKFGSCFQTSKRICFFKVAVFVCKVDRAESKTALRLTPRSGVPVRDTRVPRIRCFFFQVSREDVLIKKMYTRGNYT